ncbi:MAG: AMP-binding protein [Pseudonocardiales bacterium]|nr:AMP-binding protein [Pseudonocardiales bacterium]MBV9032119.1 AMP-binding protein [Pseudonocardiales bacterium]MBW0010597.1 AMP-binding protein [Pseudonocardiales bacterium]
MTSQPVDIAISGADRSLALGESAVVGRVMERVRYQPGAPALLWHGERISYGDLGKMVCEARSSLERLELPEEGSVGILAKKSPRAISLILACLLDRRPVLLPSVGLGAETLQRLFAQAGCGHVLSPDASPAAVSGELRCEVLGAAAAEDRSPARSPGVERTALMLTTSGSTGVPKIVPLSVPAVERFTDWAGSRFAITSGTTVLNYAPLNFDLCLLDIWTTLKHGGCVAMVDQDRATDARYLLDLLTTSEVRVIQAVPMLYRLLIDAARDRAHRLESVRHVIVTGDSIPLHTLEALPALFPQARFYNVYGSTETNDSFIHEIDMSDVGARRHIPIGRPVEGVSALVVSDGGRVVEGSGTGELWVATPFQTRGYLTEALNEGKFVSRRDGTGHRTYFRTGDIVRRHDDGSITLEGRTEGYVKVRGVRVSTQAVEQVILQHDQVMEVAVVAVPDDVAGNRLHAVVRRDKTGQLNSLSLRRHCARGLDRVAIPSTIEIVTTPLPKTPTGKVDRQRAHFHRAHKEKST